MEKEFCNIKKQIKSKGQVYTPKYIIDNILDLADYNGNNILNKHVIDNSCGDGAFLVEIVNRYCDIAIKNGVSVDDLPSHLETYIHGIEINSEEHKKCLENLNSLAKNLSLKRFPSWDIICADTMTVDKYNGKMDFVLGNPPYVRVHNLADSFEDAKKFSFAQNGMTDLYIVFYEIGIKMLNKNGVLGYISPSSFFNSLAGIHMRKYFLRENLLRKAVDLKHFQPFNATAYTAIIILSKSHRKNSMEYYLYDENAKKPYYIETLTPQDYCIADNFYFSTKENLNLLKDIFFNTKHCNIQVKNGYATLCDSVFVDNFKFTSPYIIPVIKSSKGEVKQIIYPYNKNGKPITEEELSKSKELYGYLLANKEKLLKRSFDKKSDWFLFGRSQAINDTYKNKLTLNALIRTSSDVKILPAPAGTGVYGGLYLTGDSKYLSLASQYLLSNDFSVYISLLGKYKSGGYYTFSTKDIKAYLDYKLTHGGGLS